MTERTNQGWRELCVAVATENDPTKLSSLIQELIEAIEALDNAHIPGPHVCQPEKNGQIG
jgi:hypothetical protein